MLWMSGESRFEAGRPIRGGVPICFPWFGPKAGAPDAPIHGFARIRPWTVATVAPERDGDLRADARAHRGRRHTGVFPHELRVSLTVGVGSSLSLALTVHNTDAAPRAFEEALHSYLAVSDVRQCRMSGLEGVALRGQDRGGARQPGASAPIVVAAETDRVYLGATGTVTIEDPGWRRRVVIGKTGSRTTVVWNPWVAKAKAMPDFGDEEWPGMVCVETANAMDDAVTLAPGATHAMTATLEVQAG